MLASIRRLISTALENHRRKHKVTWFTHHHMDKRTWRLWHHYRKQDATRGFAPVPLSDVYIYRGRRAGAYRLVSFFFSCSSTMASCTWRGMLVTAGDTETVSNVHFRADPDVVHNSSRFALSRLWIPDQVIPGTEHPPAEGEVLVRSAGEVQTRVLRHSAS